MDFPDITNPNAVGSATVHIENLTPNLVADPTDAGQMIPYYMSLNSDGSKLFVLFHTHTWADDQGKLVSYDLTTPYDLTTIDVNNTVTKTSAAPASAAGLWNSFTLGDNNTKIFIPYDMGLNSAIYTVEGTPAAPSIAGGAQSFTIDEGNIDVNQFIANQEVTWSISTSAANTNETHLNLLLIL